MLGMTEEEIKRLHTINGRSSHSAWLTFMYPRLKVARKLLKDSGIIFISIDDNEQANLKLLCDEIFGEGNFVCDFIWQTKKAAQGMTTENMVVDNHEYILVYAKHRSLFKFIGKERDKNNGFSNPDNDPRGLWKRQYLQRLGQGLPVRTIIDPKNGNVFSFETPYTQDKLNNWILENRIIFPETTEKYPARKEFLNEYENLQQLVTSLGLYPTKSTTEKLYNLFNGKKIFDNPKPNTLIFDLLKYTLSENKSALILDFFAGSGTTAQAVMQLNAEDGGSRKWINCTLDEPTNPESEARKAGFNTIDEIARERIKRAAEKISDQLLVVSGKERERENESNELPGIDCLAKGDGFSGGNLQISKDAPKGRTLRNVQPNAASGSIDTFQYSGRAEQKRKEGIYLLSGDSIGVKSGIGDAAGSLCQGRVSQRSRCYPRDKISGGSEQDAQFSSEQTENKMSDHHSFDKGFKHYRVKEPAALALGKITEFDPSKNFLIADDMAAEMGGIEVILATWLTADGYKLDRKPERIDIAGFTAHYMDNSILYIIEQGWGKEQTEELLKMAGENPPRLGLNTIIVYGYSFTLESMRELEIYISQNLNNQVAIEKRY
jgi:DNA modification methylase